MVRLDDGQREEIVSPGVAAPHLQSRGYRILARWAPLAAQIAVALIACGYSWHLLRHSSLWYDEAFTADLVEQSWSAFWYTIWHSDINMVVYYVLLRGWVDLLRQAGVAPTELWLRLPSALSIVMSALVALQLGRRLWGMFEGIVGAVGYAVSYLTLYSAQQTRSYGLYLLLLSLGWYAFVSALAPDADTRAPSRRWWWVAYTIMMTLAIYAQLIGVFLVAAQVLAFALLLVLPTDWRSTARRQWRAFALSLAGIGGLIVPLDVAVIEHGHDTASNWITPTTLAYLWHFVKELANNSTLTLLLITVAVLLAVALAHSTGRLAPTILLLCWLGVPVLLAYGLTQPYLNLHLFWDRYMASAPQPLTLLAASGVSLGVTRATRRVAWPPAAHIARVVCAGALLGGMILSTSSYYTNAQHATWRDPAQWIEARYLPGDGIACLPTTWCSIPLSYYLDYALAGTGVAHIDPNSPGRYDWPTEHITSESVSAIATYAQRHAHHAIFLVVATNGAASYQPEINADLAWMNTHWRVTSVRRDATVIVYRYTLPSP